MRLVSLCPSITESLIALGLRDELVGVTRYCIRPREAVRGLRRVGGTKDPDLAAIRALAPDLVFLNAEENRRADIEALASEFAVDISHPRRAADVPALLRRFGARTGREAEGEAWASRIEERLNGWGRSPSSRGRFRYVYLIWKDPWMAAGDRTYIADLLRLAGGADALLPSGPDTPDYPVVSEETIVAAQPDLLLLPDEPYRFREEHRTWWRRRLPETGVSLVSGDDFCWHGVRTLRGIEAAHELCPGSASTSSPAG